MSDVFISYSRDDIVHARRLAEALQRRGVSVFWDRVIPAGRTFEDAIEQAIAGTSAVVVLWSQHSVRSDWVRAEAAEGANRGILVPATLDGATPPLRYRVSQTADLADWVAGGSTEPFEVFLNDIIALTRAPAVTGAANVPGLPATPGGQSQVVASIRQYLAASVVCAWLGSLALAVTLAFDFQLLGAWPRAQMAAYFVTLFALGLGSLASIALGALSLKQQFVPGILQGWLWPVVAAMAQLGILLAAAQVLRQLPFVGQFEGLLTFILCSSIGPAALTVGAVVAQGRLRTSTL